MSNLYKTSIINLKNTAHLQPRYDSDIVFSTADENGDFLRFQLLTSAGKPYIIGNVNVGGKIKLDHADGSFWIDDLTVVEKDKTHQFEYQVPNELLKRDGKVTAQVLIYEKGNSNLVVAQRKFTFTIQNSIYQNITAEDKTTHIVEFAELKQEIRQTVIDINEALANGEDFVTQVKTAHKDALDAIQTLTTSTTYELNSLGAERLEEIQTTASDYLTQITTKNDEAQQMVDDFKDYLINQEVVLMSDTKDWQKYKITNDDGTYPFVNINKDLNKYQALEPGEYYTAEAPISGMGQTSAAGFTSVKERSDGTVKHITFRPYNSGQEFIMRFYNEWSDWEHTALDPTTIVSKEDLLEEINNLKTELKQYSDQRTEVLFEGDVMGAGQKLTLTKPLSDYKFIIVSGYNPAQNFSEIFATNQFETKSMILTSINLRDADGELVTMYESAIRKNSDTEIEIVTDIFYDYFKKANSAGNVERWHYNRIEGIR